MSATGLHSLRSKAFVALAIFCAIVTCRAQGGTPNPLLPEDLLTTGSFGLEASTCNTYARLSYTVKGGECSASITTSCSAATSRLVEVQNVVQSFFQDLSCVEGSAAAAANSVATAIASVHAQSLIEVQCTGPHAHSKGCGFAVNNGEALALAWTEAIATAAAAAESENGFAYCISDIQALAPVLATAYAETNSQLCTEASGEIDVSVFVNVFVNSIASLFADAFASAKAIACGSTTDVECKGDAGTSGPTSAGTETSFEGGVSTDDQSNGHTKANAGGSATTDPLPCQGIAFACCTAASYPCCPGCSPLTPVVDFVEYQLGPHGIAKVLKQGDAANVCTCPSVIAG